MILSRDSIQGLVTTVAVQRDRILSQIHQEQQSLLVGEFGSAMTLRRPLDTELFIQLTYSNFCLKCNVSEEDFNAAY